MIREESRLSSLSSASPYTLETQDDKIDYIIWKLAGFPSSKFVSGILKEAQDEEYFEFISDDRNALFDELKSLPIEELDRRFVEVQLAVASDVDRVCMPAGATIFAQWIEKDAWSATEALCVWLGLDPRFGAQIITWAQKNYGLALAAVEILERWELINRATWIGALSLPIKPKVFADWANSKRSLPEHFDAWLQQFSQNADFLSRDQQSESQIAELEIEVERLRKNLTEINQPHYQLSVKLFGALCAGMYGHRNDKKRNTSTEIVAEITGMFINYPPERKTVLKYIRDSIAKLDKGDVDKLASIYADRAEGLGKPEALLRNFPDRPTPFRTTKR